MNYTKEDIMSLIDHLKSYPNGETPPGFKYDVLIDFLASHTCSGSFDNGLKDEPGSVACAKAMKELQELFPDAWYALKMPQEEVLLHVGNVNTQEHPISIWRLYYQSGFGKDSS